MRQNANNQNNASVKLRGSAQGYSQPVISSLIRQSVEKIKVDRLNKIPSKKDAKKEAILQSLSIGSTVTDAIEKAGCGRATYYLWYGEDTEWGRACDAAKISRVEVAVDRLMDLVAAKNLGAIIFFLCNRAALNWKNVQRVEVDPTAGKTDVDNGRRERIADFLSKIKSPSTIIAPAVVSVDSSVVPADVQVDEVVK